MRKTRKERKEEERRILAEMEAAMQENATQNAENEGGVDGASNTAEKKSQRTDRYDDTMPQSVHCRRCKTLMENGVCPSCGFRIYVPMEKEKRDKIRLIVAGVCMVAFVVLFIISQIQKG